AYVAEMTEFARCIRSGETPRATGEDARNALEIALACIESVRRNQPVKMGTR
ncbi:Gfo/Idh/MocA family oxidoreductase, partial [Klebsiella pneumoniae]